jgi:hypothetical protein
VLLLARPAAHAAPDMAEAERELRALAAKVPQFEAITLPARGEVSLTADRSLTVDALRGVTLDEAPPELRPLAEPYDPRHVDGFPEGEAPYVAPGIQPFRFRHFSCEFNYGGWYNMTMHEYAATHGFNILYPYVRTPGQRSRLPEGTQWLRWGGFINWDEWLPKHDLPRGRYDLLVDRDLVGELVAGRFLGEEDPAGWDGLMIDMEHSVLPPEALREQEWYPKEAGEAQRQAFERKYYQGYALTYSAPMAAAKQLGYRNLSVYGWEPFLRQWWGLDKLQFAPDTYWQWATFGREIYASPATDILNPSLYVYYWSPQNVASTICNLDYNRALIATMPERKPMRPYYWTLLHGGDADYHWWSNQPVTNEEARAWTLLCLMSGTDGFDLWNWSGTGSHHVPRPFTYKEGEATKLSDIAVKDSFTCRAEGAPADQPATAFTRYDFIHVVGFDEATNTVRFQKVDRYNWGAKYGLTDDQPVYAMAGDELTPHLRAESEPVAGVVEGMALAKPLEYVLSHGEVKADVSSLAQFLETLPIVRRVQLGRLHVLATYDPQVVHGQEARQIVLSDFAGRQGLTLTLPADAETRLFVLREP